MLYGVLVAVIAGIQNPALLRAGPLSGNSYQYISPRPHATRVNPRTTIAVRPGHEQIAERSLQANVFRVVGSSSGVHGGSVVLSDDRRTVLFRPDAPFVQGERVDVELRSGIHTLSGNDFPPIAFSFTIGFYPAANARAGRSTGTPRGAHQPGRTPAFAPLAVGGSAPSEHLTSSGSRPVRPPTPSRRTHELPPDFPPVQILKDTHASVDPLFLGSFSWGADTSAAYLMILNRDGTPQYYQRAPGWDLKVQPTGILTYYDEDSSYFNAMDSAYQLIDIYRCGNGYNTNEHELRVMPDGHAWLMSYDGQEVAMDTIVPGGNPKALVFGLVIQELDQDKNVIFEWRSWDHFNITDAIYEDLTSADIDYVHGNAIEIDPDSNILISSRNMNEITKIDHETGDVIWRWGGKNNQFTFLNDPIGFEYQHAVRRLPDGKILIFDNGTFRGYSRVVEYALDEEARTATLVREYRHDPDVLGWALGYAQRLPNGNTLAGWGSANPAATEYSGTGGVLFEFDLPPEVFTYRAYTFPWKTTAFVPATDTLLFPPCPVGDSTSSTLTINNPTARDRLLTSLELVVPDFVVKTPAPVYVPAYGSADVELAFIPHAAGTVRDTLELWSTDSTSGIMQRVVLSGTARLPGLVYSPSAIDFGEITVNDTASAVIAMFSSLVEAIVIDTVYTTTSAFMVQPTRLTFSATDSIRVTFTSQQAGVFADTVYLRASAPDTLLRIPLKAVAAYARLTFAPSAVDFGEVVRGDSLTRNISVRNLSTRSVTLVSASVAGQPYSIRRSMPISLGVDDSVAIPVRFAPSTVGVFLDTVRFASEGTVRDVALRGISRDPTSAAGTDSVLTPTSFLLSQNYPNPFNPATEIRYQLAEFTTVRLVVYDLLGREVAVLVNESQPAGYYVARFDASGLASGVYVYRLTAGHFVQSLRMILLQ